MLTDLISLAKYKPQAQSEAISVVEMFDRFTQQKQRTISRRIGKRSQFTFSILLNVDRNSGSPLPVARDVLELPSSALLFLRNLAV